MDYFKINKYSSIDDNILYISNNLIEILKNGLMNTGKIVERYQTTYNAEMTMNMETNIYLALVFLYGIGRISVQGNKIRLEVIRDETN